MHDFKLYLIKNIDKAKPVERQGRKTTGQNGSRVTIKVTWLLLYYLSECFLSKSFLLHNISGAKMDYYELEKNWDADKKFRFEDEMVSIVEVGIFFEDERKVSFELSNGKIIYCQTPVSIPSPT